MALLILMTLACILPSIATEDPALDYDDSEVASDDYGDYDDYPFSHLEFLREIGIDTNSLGRSESGGDTVLTSLVWPLKDVAWYLGALNTTLPDATGRHKNTNEGDVMSSGSENVGDFYIAPEDRRQEFIESLKQAFRNTGTNATTSPAPTAPPLTASDLDLLSTFIAKFNLTPLLNLIAQGVSTDKEERLALAAGETTLKKRDNLELLIRSSNITFTTGSPTLKHQVGFRKTDPIATSMARLAVIEEGATRSFIKQLKVSSISTIALPLLGPITDCETKEAALMRPMLELCSNLSRCYRTLDGSCNNIYNLRRGAAFTCYRRELPAKYQDGISLERLAVSGSVLPSARLISTRVNNKPNIESPNLSILHMTFGQFIDHDLTSTPLTRASFNGYPTSTSPVKCCNVTKNLLHPECLPITIPRNDSFYRCHTQKCMEFVRSAPCGDCVMGPREQTNQQSAYLDGSVIYGVKPETANDLRTFTNGLLKVQVLGSEMLLPPQMDIADECNTPNSILAGQYCFKAGDGRVNEQVLLTFFHTLFVREHNRVAGELVARNPTWNDETLFQEARRVVVAELQQVTYKEFLPTLLGPALMNSSGLYPLLRDQQTTDYDPLMDAGIANVFATAAYRFGHSLISDNLLNIDKYGKVTPKELSTLFFNPFDLYKPNAMCDLARGGASQPERQVDPYFSTEVAGKLFRGQKPFGLDLVALNIKRGRDHGLRSYNAWRVFCGLPNATTFDSLSDHITPDRIAALKSVYRNVEDIDLYVGGISETPLPGAILGHTFKCLIHNQFLRIKRGDRYWFEYKNGPGVFTPRQMRQLHGVTLAKIMCNNMKSLRVIQRRPLENPGPTNPRVLCWKIKGYSLRPWRHAC